MILTNHDLSQIDHEKLQELPEQQLRRLSCDLLDDLKEARERLNQNSHNSSRPPSCDAPWDKVNDDSSTLDDADEKIDLTEKEQLELAMHGKEQEESLSSEQSLTTDSTATSDLSKGNDQTKRKPGKQPGAPGVGRQQVIRITHEVDHIPECCACCHRPAIDGHVIANTAFDELDIDWNDPENPGIKLKNTRHTHFDLHCPCGHITRSLPINTPITGLEKPMAISQWRLIGPGLATLIVCLSYRMRLSRRHIKEFLGDWLNVDLAVGTIHKSIKEAGACALPVEDQIVEDVQESSLLHIDETSWKEGKLLMWLWVFCNDHVVAYWIGFRSMEILNNVLGDNYLGNIMSDGYNAYRHFINRLRCWAHLLRKAKGLTEALTPSAQTFGRQTINFLDTLINAIYEAREHPPDKPLTEIYKTQLDDYRAVCESMVTSSHEKARALAKEFLNDWDIIFRVLLYPHLPLTNNEAERALRHWVILRKMLQGSRTPDGSRLLAITISIIETCRIRKQSPWIYMVDLITARRAGLPAPKLPKSVGV